MRLSWQIVRKCFLYAYAFALFAGYAANAQTSSGPAPFEDFITKRFSQVRPTWTFEQFCPAKSNVAADRVLREYGSLFASGDSVAVPDTCMFGGEAETLRFQKTLKTEPIEVNGVPVVLQTSAARALRKAVDQAGEAGYRITAYDGPIAGSRTYGDTLRLWNGRFFSAINYWIRSGRLTENDRDMIGRLDLQGRIAKIIEWEAQGICFSTDRSRSIFMSVAPPGASQHLSYIAFDVAEYGQPDVRQILNQNGWYQTVIGDPVHFTFLEVPESELPSRGLRAVAKGGHLYWVPNLSLPTN